MERFTFARAEQEKASPESAEHITVEERTLPNGQTFLYRLSREFSKGVAREWLPCARILPSGVFFWESGDDRVARNISLVATAIWRRGTSVYGATLRPEWGIDVLRCRGNLTHPDSLRGDVRARSLDLGAISPAETGAARFGPRFKVDVRKMREAIIASRYDVR